MRWVLEINGLKKRYGYRTVLNIPQYRFLNGLTWIQGENGSGKSTLLKILAGLLAYEGAVTIDLINMKKQPVAYRQLIGFSESEARFPTFVTGMDLIRLFQRARPGNPDETVAFIADFGMGEYLMQPVGEYSAGMVKKLSLLLAFVGNPAFVLLDEPYITLDERAIVLLASWISKRIERGTNVILTSHQELPTEILGHQRCLLSAGVLHQLDSR